VTAKISGYYLIKTTEDFASPTATLNSKNPRNNNNTSPPRFTNHCRETREKGNRSTKRKNIYWEVAKISVARGLTKVLKTTTNS